MACERWKQVIYIHFVLHELFPTCLHLLVYHSHWLDVLCNLNDLGLVSLCKNLKDLFTNCSAS